VREPRVRYIEWLLGRLREAGFSPELTYHAYHALDSHILGFTLWHLGHSAAAKDIAGEQDFADFAATLLEELRADGYPYLAEHAEQHLVGVEDEREFRVRPRPDPRRPQARPRRRSRCLTSASRRSSHSAPASVRR